MSAATPPTLTTIIGHQPNDMSLFDDALTHGSLGGGRDYQRLEFLGDRVLGLVIADALFARFPHEQEGQLSARLNGLVTRETCADVARDLGIAPLVRLGKQARDDGGRDSANILGDITESLIGALYLDAGLDAARRFILASWGERIGALKEAPKHPKSALLEWAAAHRRKPPEYAVVSRDGPDHAPRFTVAVAIRNAGEATATGASKQEAETAAARALLSQLETPS